MKYEFVAAQEVAFPVAVMCEVLGVSRSGYYASKGRPTPRRSKADAQLALEIAAAHRRSRRTYGSPRIHAELRAKGVCVGKKRVERLMRQNGIQARIKRRFRKTTDSNHAHPTAPNLLDRQFDVPLPDRAWATDVTYIWTLEGWLYLAVILDLCSRRVVGWAASGTNDRHLALDALRRATSARRPRPGLVHHSDQGSPYASDDYRRALEHHGAVASMSRRGDCWDNAVAESFFATLKGELVDHEVYATRAAALASIGDYIDVFYNAQRRHSTLGYVSPIEFELQLMLKSEREAA